MDWINYYCSNVTESTVGNYFHFVQQRQIKCVQSFVHVLIFLKNESEGHESISSCLREIKLRSRLKEVHVLLTPMFRWSVTSQQHGGPQTEAAVSIQHVNLVWAY